MKAVEILSTAALRVVDWLHQGTKRIAFVLEAWRSKVRQQRELRLVGKEGKR